MNFSGAKFRSLVDRSGITFSFNGSISNASGSGVFGFSGEGTKCGFSFYGVKIYDPIMYIFHLILAEKILL